MVLISNINIDLGAQTAVLTASVSGMPVDEITYDNATKQITLSQRGDLTISFFDFLAFCDQVNIFETAILFNYSPNVFSSVPFDQIISNELHDTRSGSWNLIVSPTTAPDICDYTATKANLEVYINKRSEEKIISFPEWLYFLTQLNHYRVSVKQF